MQEKAFHVLKGREAELFSYCDNYFREIAMSFGGEEYFIPALIEQETLNKAGYFSSFPQQLTSTACIKKDEYHHIVNGNISSAFFEFNHYYLTPAACLHIYPMLENQKIKEKVITTKARVFRHEEAGYTEKTRLWDFTVREIVFIGSPEFVQKYLLNTQEKVIHFTSLVGIPVKIVNANDPFYETRENRMKVKIQKANQVKRELTTNIDGIDVSLASFNYHLTHFSKAFAFDNHAKTVTGCVGFGLERWVEACREYKIKL